MAARRRPLGEVADRGPISMMCRGAATLQDAFRCGEGATSAGKFERLGQTAEKKSVVLAFSLRRNPPSNDDTVGANDTAR